MSTSDTEKKCCKCGELKQASDFYKNRSKRDGLSTECKICSNSGRQTYFSKYREENKEKIKKRNSKLYNNKRDIILENQRAYYMLNKDKKRKYREDNIQHIRERQNRRRRENIEVRLRHNVSSAIRQALSKMYSVKNSPTWNKLPYTPEQLKRHLEAQFSSEMTWENYGTYWCIDHIIPQSKLVFDDMDHANFSTCWDLKNLRPLEVVENIKKGDKCLVTSMSW